VPPNSVMIGLGNVRDSSGVILTLIVMVPDKKFQFLGQASLRPWNTPELDAP
jgi:hypothetical protein